MGELQSKLKEYTKIHETNECMGSDFHSETMIFATDPHIKTLNNNAS